MKGVSIQKILHQIELGNKIMKLFNEGKWDKSWVVITEVVHAESGTICIAKNGNAKIELKANADVGNGRLDISDASAEFSIANSKNMNQEIIARKALTPLYKIKGIRPFKETFDDRGKDLIMTSSEGSKMVFGEIEYDSLPEIIENP